MTSATDVDLIAVLAAVDGRAPRVMTIRGGRSLPSGAFGSEHRSLQTGLRAWVERQTHHPLGYLEQLYTFADRDRSAASGDQRVISISYLGLTRENEVSAEPQAAWQDWYAYFPWEDHRDGAPAMIAEAIAPRLAAWAAQAEGPVADERTRRASFTFGLAGQRWSDELDLQRYELLYEVGLVAEARRDEPAETPLVPGRAMDGDHRRILATAIARLRAKIKYRPVVFELMPPTFTLLRLQRCVEAIAGLPVHKQNFRRLMEQQSLVEETGEVTAGTSGRPARLYRFRQAVLTERGVVGAKLPVVRP